MTHTKRNKIIITRNEMDNDMLNLATVNKTKHTLLWAVVHEDFLHEDIYLRNLLDQEGSVEVILTLTT